VFSCGTKEEILTHRRKYRREHRNVKNPRKTVICVETGIEYDSALEAGRQLNINASHIAAVCRGDAGRITCGGYHWTFGKVIE
jgi:predicted phosphoribosyltransferase